jgi:CRP/FNR family transcriptional regulator
MIIDIPAVLSRLPLFAGLGEAALREIAARTIVKEYPKNTLLFRSGQQCVGLYIILEGSVKVFHGSPDGREQVLYVETPVHTLAELPLFDGAPYPASAATMEDSILMYLSRDSFQWLYRNDPEVADAIIRNLGRRLRRVVRLVSTLTLKDVPSRVATALLDHAEDAGADHSGGEFTLPITQNAMATAIATTRESVTRALRALRKDGIIDYEGARFRIVDVDKLRAAADAHPTAHPPLSIA